MKQDQYLKVLFKSPKTGSTFELKYKLFENSFVSKWRDFFIDECMNKNQSIYQNGLFYGGDFYDEENLRNEIIDTINIINTYKKDWITLKPYPNMSRQFLTALHDEFERLDNLVHYEQWGWPQKRDLPMAAKFLFLKVWSHIIRSYHRMGTAVPTHIADAITKLNVLIHKYEGIENRGRGHIDVLFTPVSRRDFSEEDYQYFSPDNNYGYLYLAYGVTGVPVLNAFSQNTPTPPVPQSNYTTGLMLSFYDTYKFLKREELNQWLKETHGWDGNDPKLALGYIPLGEIETDLSRAQLFEKIKEHCYVENVRIEGKGTKIQPMPLKPAIWPSTSEIQYHLKYVPYVQLPVVFDHEACLKEASNLIERFVEHRSYDQSSDRGAKWKSLAINGLNGDSTKTLNYPEYGVQEPTYSLTEVAKHCPQTIAFLNQVTDLKQCQRVRFMLLEPGAKISPHSDSLKKNPMDTTLAVNIALNMPEGCEFWSNLNPDGSHNQYTKKLPMKDGTFFIFNNSPYHSVVNNSNTPRIHIIIHGPIRFTHEEVLEAARKQNGITNRKQLLNEVMRKFCLLGYDVRQDNQIYIDWLSAGQDNRLTLPENPLAVVADDIADQDLMHEAIHNISMASLFPEYPTVVKMNELDSWLKTQLNQGAEFATLIGAGTYTGSCHYFISELLKTIHTLRKTDATLAGHLIHRNSDELPFLHEQFVILNLKKWQQLGCPSLGKPYPGNSYTFPKHVRSQENVHDDYTPHWMNKDGHGHLPSIQVQEKVGRCGWGTDLLAKAIDAGHNIINIPQSLRVTKKFSYPRAGRDWQYKEIKKDIEKFLNNEKNTVFVVNNEPLKVMVPEAFIPDQLISVAAGLKPASLIHQFWKDREPQEIHIIDYSRMALDYQMELIRSKTPEETKAVMKKWFRRIHNEDTAKRLADDNFQSILRSAFENDFRYMLAAFEKLKKATFTQTDFINDPSRVWRLLRPDLKTYFWHSNAFTSNVSFYLKSNQQLRDTYKTLAKGAAETLSQNVYMHKDDKFYEFYVGEKDQVNGIFSVGYRFNPFHHQEFIPLT